MDQPEFVEQTEPEEIFGLLSDDNRVEILRALWNGDEPMTFSELHDAVGIGDSGQFNYHLDKLVGQFVTRGEAGYELTAAGGQINGAIEAGSYTASGSMEPIELDRSCPTCGGTRTFYYENEVASVECDSCTVQVEYTIPPSVFVGCDREEIPGVAGAYLRAIIERMDAGFCPQCDGPIEREVCRLPDSQVWDPPEDEVIEDELPGEPDSLPTVQYECRQCGMQPTSGLGYSLLDDPAVIGFYHDRGIDIREHSLWDFTTLGEESERVKSTDPFRATRTFTADGDELTVIVDDEMRVVETDLDQTV
jgi:hypothetical protein